MTVIAQVGKLRTHVISGVDGVLSAIVRHRHLLDSELEVWTFKRGGREVRTQSIDDVTVFEIPVRKTRLGRLTGFPRRTQRFLQDRISRVDVLHLHSTFVPENLLLARFGKRYVVTPHGGYSPANRRRKYLKQMWYNLFERSYLNRAACVQALTNAEARDLRSLGCSTNVRVVPNGFEPGLIFRSVPAPSAGKHWLFLGRLAIDHKGLDLLLKGYARLIRQTNVTPPPLLLAGPDYRSGRLRLEQLCINLGIQNTVQFLGPVIGSQKLQVIEESRVFFHTSRWDGLPLAVLEAIAMARPVVVTPETHLSDWVVTNDCGWTCTPDAKGITDSMYAAMIADPSELDRKGANGRQLVPCEFSWLSVLPKLAKIYDDTEDSLSRSTEEAVV